MGKGRFEAFSDGVLAIIITIMVLELRVPHGDSLADITPLLPVFLSYVLSFVNIGIYWNNHHHLMHAVKVVNGRALWANLHLLFWLSLIPFATAWMGENHFSKWPVAAYSFILLMAGVAYYILSQTLISIHGENEQLEKAVGRDSKGLISVVLYAGAIGFCFINARVSLGLVALVSAIWLIPDKRIEKHTDDHVRDRT
jgi:uncharacterized membrane protein